MSRKNEVVSKVRKGNQEYKCRKSIRVFTERGRKKTKSDQKAKRRKENLKKEAGRQWKF